MTNIIDAATSITSGIALIAFIAALVLYGFKIRSDNRLKTVESAKTKNQIEVVKRLADRYGIPTEKLNAADAYKVTSQRIASEERKWKWASIVLAIFGILLFMLAFFAGPSGEREEPVSMSFSEVQVAHEGEGGTSRAYMQSKLGTPEHSDTDASGYDLFGAGETLWLVDYFDGKIVGKTILGNLSNSRISHPFGLYHYAGLSHLSDLIDDENSCNLGVRIPNWFTGGTAGKELEFLAFGCGGYVNSQGFRDWGIYTDVDSFIEALNEPYGSWIEILDLARCRSVNWSDPFMNHCQSENTTNSVGVSLDDADLAQLSRVAKNIPVWGFFDCSFHGFGTDFEPPSGCFVMDSIVLEKYPYISTRLKL